MRFISALLLVCISGSSLAIFNTNGDLDVNAGINYQVMYSQKVDELTVFTAQCKAKYSDYDTQITSFQAQLKSAISAINDASATNKQLSSDLSAAKAQVSSIDGLNAQIKSLTDYNASLVSKGQQSASDYAKIQITLSDANNQISSYKSSAQQYTAQISALNLTIDNNTKAAAAYSTQIDQLNAQIVTLNVSKVNEAAYKQNIVDLQNQMTAVNKAYADLYSKYSAQTDALNKANASVDAAKGQADIIATLNITITKYKSQMDQNATSMANMTNQMNQNNSDNSAKLADLNNQILVLKAQVTQYTKDNADLRVANNSFSVAAADMNKKLQQLDVLNAQISSLQVQITVAGQDKQSLNDQITKLNAQIVVFANVNSDNKNLQTKIDSLNVQITALTQSNADLLKKYNDLTTISKKLYADLQAATGNKSGVLIGSSLNSDY